MAATLNDVIKLADQLSLADRERLLSYLLEQRKDPSQLNQEEFEALLDAATISTAVIGNISDRREDWYGDDGR